MRNTFTSLRTLALLTLGLGTLPAAHATLMPVAVTGYNADVVADGAGTVISSTTDDVDGGAVGNRFNFMTSTFIGSTGVAPTSFLPNTGLFTSATTSGLTFQFASYTANNSLRINGVGTGALTLTTPRAATDVYLLATSGNGASAFTATVNFTDGTTQVFTGLSAADWFSGTTNIALRGFGRVGRDNNVIQNSTTDPRLYEFRLTLAAANASKTIQSVSIGKTATTGALNVMGVSINSTLSATRPGNDPSLAVSVFPNPAASFLTVQAPAEASAAATVQLLDRTGRTVQTAPVRNREARFDLENLAAGLYLARYQDGARTRTLKVVKH
ncbi:T9SS type A sorting domain-containing protein [Hymenobacter convexus]|uniref:T9SS type A sorting domain-containing protein n=1 Tax=Hymenobacter sp. CA1UV-4 TaxID=3063782 RepID=UPI002713D45D|nr:T9SS type A sorting domain-containing protein [Hymenobacter sp. CA1UV-4]MDO7853849.1 T9SS type A sorting domain-containing protein [Hymenobacter sp. CA1UV-4]